MGLWWSASYRLVLQGLHCSLITQSTRLCSPHSWQVFFASNQDIRERSSERHNAQLLRDWLEHSCSMAETQERKSRLSPSLSMPLRLLTYLQARIHLQSSHLLSKEVVQEKISLRLEQVVLPNSKLSMLPQLEELMRYLCIQIVGHSQPC